MFEVYFIFTDSLGTQLGLRHARQTSLTNISSESEFEVDIDIGGDGVSQSFYSKTM